MKRTLLFACVLLVSSLLALGQSTPPDRIDEAFAFLGSLQDRSHAAFFVYRDRDSGDNHFVPSGWMGDLVDAPKAVAATVVDDNHRDRPSAGWSCLRLHYPGPAALPDSQYWGGIFWQWPEKNWTGPGYDLSRYVVPGESVRLVFIARGAQGGEQAEFKAGMEGPDRFHRETGILTLAPEWKQYEIDLTGADLGNVSGGFCWVTNRHQNPDGCTIFVDEIRYEFGPKGSDSRLAEPRFVLSYVTEDRGDLPVTKFLRNACHTYDNALVALACAARGRPEDLARARLICDPFVSAQDGDPFADGRLRNGYSNGDLFDTAAKNGEPRLPGWWDDASGRWFQDQYCASSDTGNLAWAGLALLTLRDESKGEEDPYVRSALRIAEWILAHCGEGGGTAGFTGGIELVEVTAANPTGERPLTYRSTEHNIDLFPFFTRLAGATGDGRWLAEAERARAFVESMIDPASGRLFTGTDLDGKTPVAEPRPLDVNPWALLAFRDAKSFAPAMKWAEKNCRVEGVDGAVGYDFNEDRDGTWWEGTAQMALGFQAMGERKLSDDLLRSMRAHAFAHLPEGAAVFAADRDGLTTGFLRAWGPWLYHRIPHTGATCWYLFSEQGWNPYWGGKVE